MGTRGPIPKRSEQRIRRNKDEGSAVEKITAIGRVEAPPLDFDDPDGFGGSMQLQVLGITRELEDGVGLVDTYQVEVVENPGQWILGHPDYSVLGQSTILSV